MGFYNDIKKMRADKAVVTIATAAANIKKIDKKADKKPDNKPFNYKKDGDKNDSRGYTAD